MCYHNTQQAKARTINVFTQFKNMKSLIRSMTVAEDFNDCTFFPISKALNNITKCHRPETLRSVTVKPRCLHAQMYLCNLWRPHNEPSWKLGTGVQREEGHELEGQCLLRADLWLAIARLLLNLVDFSLFIKGHLKFHVCLTVTHLFFVTISNWMN